MTFHPLINFKTTRENKLTNESRPNIILK